MRWESDSKAVRVGLGLFVLAVALCFVVEIIWVTWADGQYFRRAYPNFPSRGYPVIEVSASCALVLVEALVLWRLLRGTVVSPVRALVPFGASLVGAATMFFSVLAPDHVPNYIVLHFFWLLSAGAMSLGTFLIAASARFVRHLAATRRSSG
jgi:hypothetical protein